MVVLGGGAVSYERGTPVVGSSSGEYETDSDYSETGALLFRLQGIGCSVLEARFRAQGAGGWGQGSGYRVLGAGGKVQGAGCWVQEARFRVQGAGGWGQGSGVQDPGYRVQGAGCRVQGLNRAGCVPRWTRPCAFLEPFVNYRGTSLIRNTPPSLGPP